MPSTRTAAVAVAALVALSGCSMLTCGSDGGGQPTVAESPEEYQFVFASYTDGEPFEATVTVTKGDRVLVEQNASSDGNGSYAMLGTLDEPGPYTLTVNTTLPAPGGGNRSRRVELDGRLGNATVVRVNYVGVQFRSLRLPRTPLEGSLTASSWDSDEAHDLDVRLWHRGERVAATTATVETEADAVEVVGLEDAGVYRVAVRSEGEWHGKLLVLAERGDSIRVTLDPDGEVVCVLNPDREPCTL